MVHAILQSQPSAHPRMPWWTAKHDDGVQIIDITDPYNPTHVSAVFDGIDGYDELDGADDIAITTFNNVIFAVVVSDVIMVYNS